MLLAGDRGAGLNGSETVERGGFHRVRLSPHDVREKRRTALQNLPVTGMFCFATMPQRANTPESLNSYARKVALFHRMICGSLRLQFSIN